MKKWLEPKWSLPNQRQELNLLLRYILVLVEKERRYTVLFINNKSYIDELKNKKKEEEMLGRD